MCGAGQREDWCFQDLNTRKTINMLVEQLLIKEIIKELRAEIKEEAESFVIARCKESYKQTLMTGPFTTKGLGMHGDL